MQPASDLALTTAPELDREVATVYQEQAAGLLRYATSVSGNGDMARDAVQEAFLRYFVERRYGRRIECPRAWLYQVARNYTLKRLGGHGASSEVAAETLERIAGDAADPEAQLTRSEAAREIAAALTARELECLRLRMEGMDYEEIALALGIRPGTVGALLSRVYAKLREAAESSESLRSGTAGLELLLSRKSASSS